MPSLSRRPKVAYDVAEHTSQVLYEQRINNCVVLQMAAAMAKSNKLVRAGMGIQLKWCHIGSTADY